MLHEMTFQDRQAGRIPHAGLRSLLQKGKPHVAMPPDMCPAASLQVVAGFLLTWTAWSPIFTFGDYAALYQDPTFTPNLIGRSTSEISWIGTTQVAGCLIFGCLSGRLFDRFNYFPILVLASLATVFIQLSLAWCRTYEHLVIVQGVLQGIASGFLYTPAVTLMSHWFDEKRAFAVGLVTAGAAMGGITQPLILRKFVLSYRFSFARIAHINALISLVTLAVACLLFKPLDVGTKIKQSSPTKKDVLGKPFVFLTAASFFLFSGLMVPNILSATYSFTIVSGRSADDVTKTASSTPSLDHAKSDAFYAPLINNAGSLAGRVILSTIFHKSAWPSWCLLGCSLAASILGFTWIWIRSHASFDAFLVLYGFASGGIAALPATCLLEYNDNKNIFASLLGIIYMAAGAGVVFGTPAATAIGKYSQYGPQLWTGTSTLIGAVCVMLAILSNHCAKNQKKKGSGISDARANPC